MRASSFALAHGAMRRYTPAMRVLLAITVMTGLCSSYGMAQKGKGYPLVRPDQVIEIAGAASKFAAAAKPCASYGWAAAVESVLRPAGVGWTQGELIQNFGGNRCADVNDIVATSRRLDKEHTLSTGRRIRLRVEFTPGAPTVDAIGPDLRAGRPLILIWEKKPFIIAGVTYDEVYPDGKQSYYRFLPIKQLKLIDPLAAPGSAARIRVFDSEKNNVKELEGVIAMHVQELRLGQLSDGYEK